MPAASARRLSWNAPLQVCGWCCGGFGIGGCRWFSGEGFRRGLIDDACSDDCWRGMPWRLSASPFGNWKLEGGNVLRPGWVERERREGDSAGRRMGGTCCLSGGKEPLADLAYLSFQGCWVRGACPPVPVGAGQWENFAPVRKSAAITELFPCHAYIEPRPSHQTCTFIWA